MYSPQQNPQYQAQRNPQGVAQRPAPAVAGGAMKAPTQTAQNPVAQEHFLQRQQRLYAPTPASSPAGGATAPRQAPTGGGFNASPVTSDGRMSQQPPPSANTWGQQTQAPPAPPGQFSQYQAPQDYGMTGRQAQLLQQMGANPNTLSDAVVAQMKGQARGDEALMTKQLMAQHAGQMAARGLGGGGQTQMGQAAMLAALAGNVMNSNRALDIQKAMQDRADQLQVAGAMGDFSTQASDRAIQAYQAQLAGQQAEAQNRQFYSGLEQEGSQFDRNLAQTGSQFDRNLAQEGSQFDRNLAQQGSQFDRTYTQQGQQFDADLAFRNLAQNQNYALGNKQADNQFALGNAQLAWDRDSFGQSLGWDKEQFGMQHQQQQAAQSAAASAQRSAQEQRQYEFDQEMAYKYMLIQNENDQALQQWLLSGGY